MKTLSLYFFLSIIAINTVSAQKKKDLLNEITKYRTKVTSLEQEVASFQQKQKLSEEKIYLLHEQNKTVEEEKQQLLKTISGFASVSKQKAENLSNSLETIKEKDRQLKAVNDALANYENIKLQQITAVKDSLGTLGQVKVLPNEIILSIPSVDLLKTEKNQSEDIAIKRIVKIGNFLKSYPNYNITIEGNCNLLSEVSSIQNYTDSWQCSALQATQVAKTLNENCAIDLSRITVIANGNDSDLGAKSTISFKFIPDFAGFYQLIKENMKDSNR